jgi:8-O-methyltransferase
MDLATGFWRAKVLSIASEIGLFELLAGTPLPEEEIRRHVGLHPRGSHYFLEALTVMGLLERQGGRYGNTPLAQTYLVPGQPHYFGGFIRLNDRTLNPSWNDLADTLRTGEPRNKMHGDPVMHLSLDNEGWDNLWGAFDQFNEVVGEVLVKLDWSGCSSFLDVGGSRGNLAAKLVQSHPHLKAAVFDLPYNRPTFDRHMGRLGTAGLVEFKAGDFLKDSLPQADIMIMGHALHNWETAQQRMLLGKVYQALPPGGVLHLYDQMIDEENPELFSLLLSLNGLVRTYSGGEYMISEAHGWLRDAGFDKIETRGVGVPRDTLLSAHKAA